jgi:hypothetical protein
MYSVSLIKISRLYIYIYRERERVITIMEFGSSSNFSSNLSNKCKKVYTTLIFLNR